MKRPALLLLPLLLGGCALLGHRQESAPPAVAAPAEVAPVLAAPLTAQAEATTRARAVTVTLALRNGSAQPLTLRYAAQVNWGRCGLPPYVALARADGRPVAAPAPAGRLTCPELRFTRTLAPGEVFTLRRTLPPLPLGTYTLTAWFDGEQDGQPLRVQAAPVEVEVR